MPARLQGVSFGFTLLEILIAIGILMLLGALATVSYRPFGQRVDLQTTTQQILTALHQARDRTIASEGGNRYGVHFESDQYVLFTGTTYDPLGSDNEVHELPRNLEIYSIAVGGSEVVFDRIEGTTSNAGSVGLRLTDKPDQTASITILASGQTSLAGDAPAPADTRLTDARHVHLDLGRSIQNATTLTLIFSDAGGPVTENVTMADYFNADKSSFDWRGTVAVGGESQTLRVHTHELTATSTVLSIVRDGRENTKAVDIEIDADEIISYTADGTASVGALGGTMEVQ